jgi:transcriptional regulator
VKFPVQDSQALKERLKGVKIKTHPAEEVLDRLPYPTKTSAVLLHEIKLAISALEEQK